MSDKTEQLAEILFGDEIEAKQKFEVTDYKTADWCVVKAKQAADHLAKVDALYQEYKYKLEEWRRKAEVEAQRTIETMEAFLRPFIEQELAGKKKRSLELLNGKVGFRKLPDRVEWHPDFEDDIIDWCETELPDAVKVKKSLLKTELKKALDSGQEVPGITHERGADKFYIDAT